MAGTNGKQKTVRDLVLSLVLIGLMAGVIYLFLPHDDSAPDIKRVSYDVELVTARRAASYPVEAPEGLPDSWKATSVRFDGSSFDHWHLGFQDPKGQYVAIEQSTQKAARFIDEASRGSEPTKTTQEIDGRVWRHYTGGRYDALVLEDKGATTLVTGTASFTRLAEMAKALETS
ncbi:MULTISPECIES: DUF4245 domain-containing protein [Streptomyces]|uniref:DUF4245 domain-containing protein n=1 Tax=Streptomyces griseoaurantiacus TaxID=68213 RepID=A0A1G7RX27_9ACTN|nr:DUF4245 domain-containing protein [Streptomyces jietaisiensis]NJP73566.1 DUF4245 domain-containing protein [Streptomyces sp. C1-2]SDG15291.1 Protein of unknown function [Streptomyces jietaisiensis]